MYVTCHVPHAMAHDLFISSLHQCLYICAYIYEYTCMSVHICMHVRMSVHLCMHINICLHMCMRIWLSRNCTKCNALVDEDTPTLYVYICKYVYACICVSRYMCTYKSNIYVHKYVNTYMDIHTYIYIYIYIYVCTYIYMYIHMYVCVYIFVCMMFEDLYQAQQAGWKGHVRSCPSFLSPASSFASSPPDPASVWRDSLKCVPWLTKMCNDSLIHMMQLYVAWILCSVASDLESVWHDSFMCAMTYAYVTRLNHSLKTHLHVTWILCFVASGSRICVTWPTNGSHVCHDSQICDINHFFTWRFRMWHEFCVLLPPDPESACYNSITRVWHDPLMCVPYLMQDESRSGCLTYVCHDSLTVPWLKDGSFRSACKVYLSLPQYAHLQHLFNMCVPWLTRSTCVCHDSSVQHVCAMTHVQVCHDSSITHPDKGSIMCVSLPPPRAPCRAAAYHMCDVIHSHIYHDSCRMHCRFPPPFLWPAPQDAVVHRVASRLPPLANFLFVVVIGSPIWLPLVHFSPPEE